MTVRAHTTSKGLRVRYDDVGSGEPALLFLHGWCSSRAVFSPLLSRSGRHRRGLALDFRGHGESDVPQGDFTSEHFLEDALAVVEVSGAQNVVPVAVSDAGWVALDLRRRLGTRMVSLVLVDWITTPAPPAFLEALRGLQTESSWREARDGLFSMWLEGVTDPDVIRSVREDMARYDFQMWQRAARDIGAAYQRRNSPIEALASLDPPVATLHLYSRARDPGFPARQQSLAGRLPWFHSRELSTRSHHPTIEGPEEVAQAIEEFIFDSRARG
jgi:pimeloyl-ACP methyl ester carboxylesterase